MGMAPRPPPNPPFRVTAQGFPGGDAAVSSHASMAGFQGQWPVGDLGGPPGGHQGITSAVHSGIAHHLAHQQQQQQQLGSYGFSPGPVGLPAGASSLAAGSRTGLQSSVPPPPPNRYPRPPPKPPLLCASSVPAAPAPQNAQVRHDSLLTVCMLMHQDCSCNQLSGILCACNYLSATHFEERGPNIPSDPT